MQRCSSNGCDRSLALVWTACIASDGNLAVRRNIAMNTREAVPAAARRAHAQGEPGCRCDLSQPTSASAATVQHVRAFGTIREMTGERQTIRCLATLKACASTVAPWH